MRVEEILKMGLLSNTNTMAEIRLFLGEYLLHNFYIELYHAIKYNILII